MEVVPDAGIVARRPTRKSLHISIPLADNHDHGPCPEPTKPVTKLEFFPRTPTPEEEEGDLGSEPMQLSMQSGSSAYYTPPDHPPSSKSVPKNGAHTSQPQTSEEQTGSDEDFDVIVRSIRTAPRSSEPSLESGELDEKSDSFRHTSQHMTVSEPVGVYGVADPHATPFEKNWTEIRCLAEGLHGYVSIAVRKPDCLGFKPADTGKVFAVKRSKNRNPNGRDHHSLYKERHNHEVACLASDAKDQNLFAFMTDYDRASDHPTWISMPFYDGPTLWELQNSMGWMPASFVLDVAQDVLDALNWLHTPSSLKPAMAHGDLHASNVVLDMAQPIPHSRYPRIRILDLGLAQYTWHFDSEEAQAELQAWQHSDINDFGNLIHNIAHQDRRQLGRGMRKQPDAFSHCFDSPELGCCPRESDPYAPRRFDDRDHYWFVILEDCYVNLGEAWTRITGRNPVAQLKAQLAPYFHSRDDISHKENLWVMCMNRFKDMRKPVHASSAKPHAPKVLQADLKEKPAKLKRRLSDDDNAAVSNGLERRPSKKSRSDGKKSILSQRAWAPRNKVQRSKFTAKA